MRKILFIGDKTSLGGLKIITKNLSKTIPKNHNNNIYFINSESLNSKNIFKIKSLLSIHFYNSKFYLFFLLFDLVKICFSGIPKYAIILTEINSPIGFFLNKLFGVEYFLFIHGNYSTYLPNNYNIYYKSFKKCKKIISVSEYSKKLFLQRVFTKNIEVLHWGVSKELFYKDKSIKKLKRIVFNGNISKKRKGFDYLLSYIEKYRLKYELIIISNHEKNDIRAIEKIKILEKYKINYQLFNNISVKNLREIYNSSLFNFACADPENINGEYEGFNMTIIESSNCGTLTIASKNTANECAMKYCDGYLIDFNNLLSLREILIDKKVEKKSNLKPISWNTYWEKLLNLILD